VRASPPARTACGRSRRATGLSAWARSGSAIARQVTPVGRPQPQTESHPRSPGRRPSRPPRIGAHERHASRRARHRRRLRVRSDARPRPRRRLLRRDARIAPVDVPARITASRSSRPAPRHAERRRSAEDGHRAPSRRTRNHIALHVEDVAAARATARGARGVASVATSSTPACATWRSSRIPTATHSCSTTLRAPDAEAERGLPQRACSASIPTAMPG
jgi:hypothetical protein